MVQHVRHTFWVLWRFSRYTSSYPGAGMFSYFDHIAAGNFSCQPWIITANTVPECPRLRSADFFSWAHGCSQDVRCVSRKLVAIYEHTCKVSNLQRRSYQPSWFQAAIHIHPFQIHHSNGGILHMEGRVLKQVMVSLMDLLIEHNLTENGIPNTLIEHG